MLHLIPLQMFVQYWIPGCHEPNVEFLSPAPTRLPMKTVWKVVCCRMLPRNLVPPQPSMSILLCPWPCPPALAMFIYSLFLRSLYCNNLHGQAIMHEFYKIRCVSFMLLNCSPIVEIFMNPPLQSIDLIIEAITTTSLHHGRKKTRCVYLHPTDLLRDHNMSLTKTTIRNLKQTSRLHSKTRRKTQNFIVNLLLQMKKLLLSR